MKKTITILLIAIMLMSSIALVFAEEIATNEDKILAGTTLPDDGITYNLEIVSDNFLGLFSQNKKLLNAQERLSEALVMLDQNKSLESQIALEKLNFTYQRILNKTQLNETKIFADNLGQKIKQLRLNNTNMTPELRYQIKVLISEHRNKIFKERNVTKDFNEWINRFEVVNGTIRKR